MFELCELLFGKKNYENKIMSPMSVITKYAGSVGTLMINSFPSSAA